MIRRALYAAFIGITLAASANPVRAQAGGEALWDAAGEGDVVRMKRGLGEGVDVNVRDEKGWSPLIHACDGGHLEVVEVLVEAGAEVDQLTRAGSSPLAFAAGHGHTEIVRFLLERGADPDKFGGDTGAPLIMAAQHGRTEAVRLLIEAGADIHVSMNNDATPLHQAAQNNRLSAGRLLLEAGANPHLQAVESVHGQRYTPLFMAANNGHVEMIDLLLRHGAGIKRTGRHDLNVFGPDDTDSPLDELSSEDQPETDFSDLEKSLNQAAYMDRFDVVERLLIAWRNREKIAMDGGPFADSDLCRAAAEGDLDEVTRLMEAPEAPAMGELAHAVNVAWQEGRVEVDHYLRPIAQRRVRRIMKQYEAEDDLRDAAMSRKPESYQRTLALLLRGVDVDAVDDAGNTALHWAVSSESAEKVELLLDHGADVSHRNAYGRTPLIAAAGDEQYEIARLLLERGAELDEASVGLAMVMFAGSASEAMIEDLLDRGADPNARAILGRTALMQAAEAGNVEVVRLLIDRGADVNYKSERGYTARMLAENEFRDEAAAVLKDAGAAALPNTAPNPLHEAVRRDDVGRVKELIARGVDLERSGEVHGKPPLNRAVTRPGMANLLLDAGAEPNAVGDLVQVGDESRRSVELLKRLIAMGGDVEVRVSLRVGNQSLDGTPLMFAACYGKSRYIEPLLEAGANVDAVDEEGRTALDLAVLGGHNDIAAMLRRTGARP